MALLGTAVLILWIGLILGVETGYSAWQGIPDPPEEAFSDTGGPFFILFMGWFPSLVLLGAIHLLLRRCWAAYGRRSGLRILNLASAEEKVPRDL